MGRVLDVCWGKGLILMVIYVHLSPLSAPKMPSEHVDPG